MKTLILIALCSIVLAANLNLNNKQKITLDSDKVVTLVGDNQNPLTQELGVRVFKQITQYNNANNDLARIFNLVTASNALADWVRVYSNGFLEKLPNKETLQESVEDYALIVDFEQEPLDPIKTEALPDVEQRIIAVSYANAYYLSKVINSITEITEQSNNLIDLVTGSNVIYMRGRLIGSTPQTAMNEIEEYLEKLFEDVVITRSTQLKESFDLVDKLAYESQIQTDTFYEAVSAGLVHFITGRHLNNNSQTDEVISVEFEDEWSDAVDDQDDSLNSFEIILSNIRNP